MATTDPFAPVLGRLHPLDEDHYFTAFGGNGRYFFGTPKGYASNDLPFQVVERILSGTKRRVLFASFGHDFQHWFVTYEYRDGSIAYELGPAATPRLVRFYESHCEQPQLQAGGVPNFIRTQFGPEGSYLAWTSVAWISDNVPAGLVKALRLFSSHFIVSADPHELPRMNGGSFTKCCFPINVAWHPDGSFYVKMHIESGTTHVWNFATNPLKEGWKTLWGYFHRDDVPRSSQLQELAHVAIDPHSPTADRFTFLKLSHGTDPDFVTQLEPGNCVHRISPPQKALDVDPRGPLRPTVVRALKSGRPSVNDTWELELKKNELLTVIKYHGKNWYHLQNSEGECGYAHASWIDSNWRSKLDTREAYHRFHHDSNRLFDGPPISSFLDMKMYVRDSCRQQGCDHDKGDAGLGICVHELAGLLKGSRRYSYTFVKEQRVQWHPDRFSRICIAEQRNVITKKAGQLFVLMSTLMGHLEKEIRN